MIERKKLYAIIAASIIALSSIYFVLVFGVQENEVHEISIRAVLELTSERNAIEDTIIISDENPMLSLISTPIACWYNIGGENNDGETDYDGSQYGLKPLLIAAENELAPIQDRFNDLCKLQTAMVLGDVGTTGLDNNFQLSGTPGMISLAAAEYVYLNSAGALLIEDNQNGYELGVIAAPIASYLNIPILILDSGTSYSIIRSTLDYLDVEYTIILGHNGRTIAQKLGYDCILLDTPEQINDNALKVIQHRFNEINYITLTNPTDVIPPQVESVNEDVTTVEVNNIKIQTGNFENDIVGESTHELDISIPDGINRIQIYINFTNIENAPFVPLKDAVEVEPLIFGYLYDPNGNLAAFAPSFSYDVGKNYLETQTYNCSGNYRLVVSVYYGTKGFSTYAGTQLGISKIDAEYDITVVTSTRSTPHLPMYPKLSMMAPYLTAAHGGLVLADPAFALTQDGYELEAEGYGTGPYYETALHEIANARVGYIVEQLNQTIESLQSVELQEGYLSGPAWLAILAGPNMVPQYYEPKDASWVEDPIYGVGWATDIKYSLDLTLSNARVLGQNVGDVSALIARTLFYEPYVEGHTEMIKQEYGSSEEWKNNFHFLAGEMGGRTGWFFWQRGFASEVEQHGFQSEEYYQNHENDRQSMIRVGAYERANYFDLMMHGNWYWYVPELNGIDSYSTSVKNSDLKKASNDWELGPSIYNSGSCILGRIDGITPIQSLTFAFFHAGINAFFSATRSTGSEARAGTIEMGLIYDDISVGEALRADKLENQEPAAYYVRLLYADPAFNPYEPENGFSDQGRPKLVTGTQEGGTRGQSGNSIIISEQPELIKALNSRKPTEAQKNQWEEIDQSFAQYHTYETLVDELYEIAANHSEIAVLYSIGTTYEGRDIWAMKVSDNPHEYEEDEPEVLFTGAHHGREWPSYEVPLYFLKFLVENYGQCPTDNDADELVNEARISWLVDNRQIWIIPMVNPDGVAYAHEQYNAGETNTDNLWRKNREPNSNPATGNNYPESMWGTDLNRNYGFRWGELGYQGYADPSREDYIGPLDKTDDDNDRRLNEDKMDNIDNDGDGKIDEDPRGGFSTAETIAIKKLVEEHDFVITLNFHTYGGKIYWPWMWTLELPPDEELFCHLAKGMAKFNGYEYRNMSERQQQELSRHPPVDGDSNDWMYGKHNILAYTIEIGTQFIPPEDEIVPTCRLHLGSNLLVVEVADDPWQLKFGIKHEPLENTTSTKGYTVKVTLNNPNGLELSPQGLKVCYSTDGKNYEEIIMGSTGELNEFEARIPGQSPGTRISYYVMVTDKDEHTTQLPKYAPYTSFGFRVIVSRGEATASLLAAHVIFIMGAIIFVVAAMYYSLKYLSKGYGINKVIQMSGIATGMIFIGGFPLGWIIAYQVFRTPWTGIPFGWDITDNKTLVIFLYWTISLYMVRGTTMNMFSHGRGRYCPWRWLLSFTKKSKLSVKKLRKDTITHNRFAKLAIIGAIITLALYLIPHSLMATPLFSIFLFGLLAGIFLMPTRKRA